MKKYLLSIIFCILIPFLILQSCQFVSNVPTPIIIDSESFELEWDPPDISEKNPIPVLYYNVYYKIHGLKDWNLLGAVSVDENPSYEIFHSLLGNGSFDFAVSAVYYDYIESNIQTSLHYMSVPMGGWYIVWIRF